MKIGKNIKAIRVSQKIEQKELANRLHISNKTVSSWECDRTEPNIGMFEKIAEALNVTKMELLEDITRNQKHAPAENPHAGMFARWLLGIVSRTRAKTTAGLIFH